MGTEQAVVHKDAVQVLANGPVEQHGHNSGINAAGQGTDNMLVADLGPGLFHHALHKGGHGPVGSQVGNLEEEVFQHAGAIHAVVHFGMELHGIDAAFLIGHGSHIQGVGAGRDPEAGRHLQHAVAVAHPHLGGGGHVLPQGGLARYLQHGRAVFPGVGLRQASAQGVREQLHAVADAEHRDAELQQSLVQPGRVSAAHTGRTAGQHKGLGLHGPDLVGRDRTGMDFRIDASFANSAGDELCDLRAVIYDNDLVGHIPVPSCRGWPKSRPLREARGCLEKEGLFPRKRCNDCVDVLTCDDVRGPGEGQMPGRAWSPAPARYVRRAALCPSCQAVRCLMCRCVCPPAPLSIC